MDFRPTDGQRLLQSAARDFLARHCPLEAPPGGEPLRPRPRRPVGEDGRARLDGAARPRRPGRQRRDHPRRRPPRRGDGACRPRDPVRRERGRRDVTPARLGRRRPTSAPSPTWRGGARICALAVLEDSGELAPERHRPARRVGVLDGPQALRRRRGPRRRSDRRRARGGGGHARSTSSARARASRCLPMASMAGDAPLRGDLRRRRASRPGTSSARRAAAGTRSRPPCGSARSPRAPRWSAPPSASSTWRWSTRRRACSRAGPSARFQAIQHACADLARGVESARPLVLHAAWRAQEGLPCEAEVAMAASYAGDACLAVARKAHQVFGAIGYCDEHPLHRLHKQIIAARLAYGDGRTPRGDDRARHRPRVARGGVVEPPRRYRRKIRSRWRWGTG